MHEQFDKKVRANHLNSYAVKLQVDGRFQEALAHYFEAAQLYNELGDKAAEGRCLSGVGASYKDLRDMIKAKHFLEQAIILRKAAGDKEGEAMTLLTIGPVYKSLGDAETASFYLNQALVIGNSLKDDNIRMQAMYNLGELNMDIGFLHKAKNWFEQSINISIKRRDYKEFSKCLNALGVVSSDLGDFKVALGYYHQSLGIAKETRHQIREAINLGNIGSIYYAVGDFRRALSYFDSSLRLIFSVRAINHAVPILNKISLIYLQWESRLKEAENYLQNALQITRSTGNKLEELTVLVNLSIVNIKEKQYDKAFEILDQALKIQEQSNFKWKGNILFILSTAQFESGLSELSMKTSEEVLKITKNTGDKALELRALFNLGVVLAEQGNYQRAFECLQNSITIIENIRNEIALDDLRVSFFSQIEIHDVYYVYLAQLIQKYYKDSDLDALHKSFFINEKRRGRAILDLLFDKSVRLATRPPEVIDQENNLIYEIKKIEQTLLEGRKIGEERKKLEQKRAELELNYELLKLQSQSFHLSDMKTLEKEILTSSKVQTELLDDSTALLEFSIHKDKCYLWVITNNHFQVFTLGPTQEISEKLSLTLEAVNNFDFLNYCLNAHKLYQLIIEPVEKLINGKKLIIVPDYELCYLPFELLLKKPHNAVVLEKPTNETTLRAGRKTPSTISSFDQYQNLDYLIKHHKITYAPSATIQNYLGEQELNTPSFDFMGFAPFSINSDLAEKLDQTPLPHSEKEVRKIAELFEKNKTVIKVGADAKKDKTLLESMQECKYLHFATHGYANQNTPIYSSLLLYPGEDKDPTLQPIELFRLKTKAEMVVLSACETGLGRLHHGEGIVGLAKPFLVSGTKAVLASLWSVADESTSELMQSFYHGLIAKNETKPGALRNAKLSLINHPKFSAPYFWAPFILVGE